MRTASQRARDKGLESFDLALPQPAFQHWINEFGMNPTSHIVWCYDGEGMMGKAVALTKQGEHILEQCGSPYDHMF